MGQSRPLTLVIFVRIEFRVVGVTIVRVRPLAHAFGRQMMEQLVLALSPEMKGHNIGSALSAYVELIAGLIDGDGDGARIVEWRSMAAGDAAELSPPHALTLVESPGAQLGDDDVRPPPHLDGAQLFAVSRRYDESPYRCLRRVAACVVRSLVAADSAASPAVRQAADRLVTAADELSNDAELTPKHVDEDVSVGRYLAIFGETDAQFFVSRIDAMEAQIKGGSIKTPGAAAVSNEEEMEILIRTSSMKLSQQGEWQLDDKPLVLYAHQLERSGSVAMASDREATIRSGMAIDLYGNALRLVRPWIPVGVVVEDASFARQLNELHGVINFGDELRPELLCHWHMQTAWGTDPKLLLDRCYRHIDKAGDRPPSAGDGREENSQGWRCRTWAEVVDKCGSIDMRNAEAREAEAEEEAEADACSTAPCTRPRCLELYCGRAGWSASFRRLGCDVWFLDKDRQAVAPSFAAKPTYHDQTGLVVCKNGLSPKRYIELDFLDFAMVRCRGRTADLAPAGPQCGSP